MMCLILWLQCSYNIVTMLLHYCYTAMPLYNVTMLLQYNAILMVHHMLLQCYNNVATMLTLNDFVSYLQLY